LDLGSGGGLDVLLSARRVGPDGCVFGVDASPDMIDLARAHAAESGVTNVEFRLGYLEAIPLSDAAVDVVISNCVFTLSTDKPRALAEAARVLRPGGRFGTLTADKYRDLLRAAGFATMTITRTHPITGGLYSAIVQASTPAPAST
jgi:ubiquinone/menaquinone biosynthesis C-methylase UbiE